MLVVCTQVVLWMLCVIVIGDICIVFGVLRVGVVVVGVIVIVMTIVGIYVYITTITHHRCYCLCCGWWW